MANLTPELIEKAKTARSAEELLTLAKENGVEMTNQEAKACFSQLNPTFGELDDDDLDNVAGGGCGGSSNDAPPEEPKYATVFCTKCCQTVQIERMLDPEEDIDGYFGVCPICGKIHFNL